MSQVLPGVTLLQYVPEGSTVILEQPEIHLHPLAQAGLADVIRPGATYRNVQIILESHSEHLLLRLQRRIAEGSLGKDDVKFYLRRSQWVSTLTPLDVDMSAKSALAAPVSMGDAFARRPRPNWRGSSVCKTLKPLNDSLRDRHQCADRCKWSSDTNRADDLRRSRAGSQRLNFCYMC